MAGTLHFNISPVHIYQRRFDSESLAYALRDSHVYIISRRPVVRITYHFAHRNRVFINFSLRGQSGAQDWEMQHNLVAGYNQVLSCRTFEDGAYFVIESESSVDSALHGDSWALASFLSGAPGAVADQEVLYIGQAYGKDGEQNSWLRTRRHQTLQHIYEEHVGLEWDIFVTPLRIDHSMFITDDHLDGMDDGFDFSKVQDVFSEPLSDCSGSRILKPGVDLVEHGLIAAFQPPYNKKLKKWDQDSSTLSIRRMQEARLRLLLLHLDGWFGLARFHSAAVPQKNRSHFFYYTVPASPKRPTLWVTEESKMSSWRPGAILIRYGPDLAASAEWSGVEMKIFGEQAPAIRRPPTVVI